MVKMRPPLADYVIPTGIAVLFFAVWIVHTLSWIQALPALGILNHLWHIYYEREHH